MKKKKENRKRTTENIENQLTKGFIGKEKQQKKQKLWNRQKALQKLWNQQKALQKLWNQQKALYNLQKNPLKIYKYTHLHTSTKFKMRWKFLSHDSKSIDPPKKRQRG